MKTRLVLFVTLLLSLVAAAPAASATSKPLQITTVETGHLSIPIGVAVEPDGTLYIPHDYSSAATKVSFDSAGVSSSELVGFTGVNYMRGAASDGNGNLYVASYLADQELGIDDDHAIRKVSLADNSSTIVDIGPGQKPLGVALDAAGAIYFTDGTDQIKKVTYDGNTPVVTHLMTDGINPMHGLAIADNGDVYLADANNHRVLKVTFDASGNQTSVATVAGGNGPGSDHDQLHIPHDVALDAKGVLFIVDTGNQRIQRVSFAPVVVPNKRELTGAYKNASGTNASVARLYMATFARQPEGDGFNFWLDAHNNGKTLQAMADDFVAGKEFGILYGNTTNTEFVDLMYQNVMGRTPGAKAKTFWLNELDTGNRTRAQMLLWFSESKEFKILTHTS